MHKIWELLLLVFTVCSWEDHVWWIKASHGSDDGVCPGSEVAADGVDPGNKAAIFESLSDLVFRFKKKKTSLPWEIFYKDL